MSPVYPVNDYGPLMPGLVMAGVAIFHVFLAQFAVGGGFLLCYFQWLAMTGRNQTARRFIDDYFKVLVLISFVLGALTGVGIWFTAIQVSAVTIGEMVFNFHWVWATEWAFFCLEVVAGYCFYRYHRKLSDRSSLLLRLLTLVAGAVSTMTALAGWELWYQFRSSDVVRHDVEINRMAKLSLGSLAIAAVFGVVYTTRLDGPIQGHLIGTAGVVWLAAVAVGVTSQIVAWVITLRKGAFAVATLTVITVGNLVTLVGAVALREIIRLSQIDLSRITDHARDAWTVGGFSLFLVAALIAGGLIILCVYITRSAWRNEPSTIC